MTTKQKELRKQRIKNILLKTLHIICYFLSIGFILICVLAGVKSCEKSPNKVSAEEELSLNVLTEDNIDDYFVYEFKYSSSFTISQEDQALLNPNISFNFSYDSLPDNVYEGVILNGYAYTYSGGDYFEINSLVVTYSGFTSPFATSPYLYTYRLNNIVFVSPDGSYHGFINKTSVAQNSADLYSYNITASGIKLIFSSEINDPLLLYFFQPLSPSKFTFNKQFNYNATLGTNLNGLYGSASFDSSGANMRYKNYDVGYFISNGLIFNQIQYWAIQSDGNTVNGYDSFGNFGLLQAPSGYWIYSFIYYRNTDNGNEILVNYHDMIPYSNSSGGTSLYYANTSTWVNDSFRYITFLQPLSTDLNISINAFNNNNQNYYSGQIYSDGGDVFTLLSYGFSSLSDFWSLTILPGISLGVLFFLPAVVGIIITIVHLLRK